MPKANRRRGHVRAGAPAGFARARGTVASLEPLESRLLLAANPLITEFMADNNHTLKDYYNEYPDWIEVFNPDTAAVDLTGWHLTDDSGNLDKWTFPSATLGPATYLKVFASDRDTVAPNGELHTSFKLNKGGGYLALVKPGGAPGDIVCEYDEYPDQVTDVSFGLASQAATYNLVSAGASGKWLVPSSAGDLSSSWNTPGFSDTSWNSGTTGMGNALFWGPYGTGGTWNLYEVVSTTRTWIDAYNEAKTRTRGALTGHLVTIRSAVENSFVQGLIGADSWIGLTDSDTFAALGAQEYGDTSSWPLPPDGSPPTSSQRGAGFVWVTGESFTYQKWDTGQPNNGGTYGSDAVRIYKSNGNWNDDQSGEGLQTGQSRPYVIEYDLGLVSPPGNMAVYETHGSSLGNINDAITLINGGGGTVTQYSAYLVNFNDPQNTGTGHFTGDVPFGGNTSGDDNNFALRIHGTIRIASAGTYTFGVNSDDGFRLQIGGAAFTSVYGSGTISSGDTMEYTGGRASADSLGVTTLSAGDHDFELYYFEGGGGSQVELFAASGSKSAFDSTTFKLVGDQVNGGLPLVSPGNLATTGINLQYTSNTSAFIRIPFTVSDPDTYYSLILRMRYDDGFVAYINGTEIDRFNAPTTPAWNSSATANRLPGDAVRPQVFDDSDMISYLVSGTNVLAIQLLNYSSEVYDFLVLPELTAMTTANYQTDQWRYFVTPTPGKDNSPGTADLGPIVTGVSEPAVQPTAADPILVSASIRQALHPVQAGSATLHYRVMYNLEQTLPMYDDGLHGDGLAGDGVYGATISAGTAAAGQMVRWYVTAQDTSGLIGKYPLFPTPTVRPGSSSPQYVGTVIANPAITSGVPIYYWFVENPSAANTETGTRAELYYAGQFYDNILAKDRGRNTTNGHKLDFNPGYHLQWDPLQPRVEEINLNFYNPSGYDNSAVRQVLGYDTHTVAGGASSTAFLVCVLQNGVRYNTGNGANSNGIATFYEEPDEDFLSRRDLYSDGALYKHNTADDSLNNVNNFIKKTREWQDRSDLQALINGINQTGLKGEYYDNPDFTNLKVTRRDSNINFTWSGAPDPSMGATDFSVRWTGDVLASYTQTYTFYFSVRADDGVRVWVNDQPIIECWTGHGAVEASGTIALTANKQYTIRVDYFQGSSGGTAVLQWSSASLGKATVGGGSLEPVDMEALYLYDYVNIPAMINYIAAQTIIFDNDHVAKNYFLYCDTYDADGNPNGSDQWLMIPWDKDLTFGKNWGLSDYTEQDPYAHPLFGDYNHRKVDSKWNALIDAVLSAPVIRQMYLRRLRTLMDQLLQPPFYENWLDQLWGSIQNDGIPAVQSRINEIRNTYLPGRRTHLYGDHSNNPAYPDYAGIPGAQAGSPTINFGAIDYNPASGNQEEEYIQLVNPNSFAVDISGWKLAGAVNFTFIGGTVLPANGTMYVSPNIHAFRSRTTGPKGGQGLYVAGAYEGQLSARGETILLHDAGGAQIASLTYAGNPTQAQQALRITELMYHPHDGPNATPTEDHFEFVELKNISTQTLNLSGVKLTAGIDYTFGSVNLAAGQFIVVVNDRSAFESRYGAGLINIAGEYNGMLDNGGERIQLKDSVGEVVLEFSYDDAWYPSTDAGGRSLVAVNPAQDVGLWDSPTGWRHSRSDDGSPGCDESTLLDHIVVINEALTHHADANPVGDWIELYNTTGSPLDISGWWLSDSNSLPRKYQLQPGTIIPDHGYLVFGEVAQFGNAAAPGALIPFGLSELGEKIVLSSINAAGQLDGYRETESFDALPQEVTIGRYITSTGKSDFVALTVQTRGTANAPPILPTVAISEVMYNPAVGADAFIEVHNVSGAPAPLYDPLYPNNTWAFTNGISYTFPAGITLASDEYILVVPIAPALFQSKYNIDPAVRIFGSWAGTLDLAGERVTLSRPGDPEPDLTFGYILEDSVDYLPTAPWPVTAAGTSLARYTGVNFGDDPIHWARQASGGTPGRANDFILPTGDVVDVSPDPRNTAVATITINFTEAVNGFDKSDLSLTWDSSSVSLTTATLTSVDNINWTLGNLSGLTGASGNYVLTLTAVGSGITDAAGNPLAGDAADGWAVDTTAPTVVKVLVAGSAWSGNVLTYLRNNGLGDGGYAVPVGSGVQLKPLPWSNINQVKVVFSENVLVDSTDMLLSGSNVPTYAVGGFSYDAVTFTATWTLSAPIAADKVRLELNADGTDPIRDGTSNTFDGEWTNPTSTGTPSSSVFPSGNGVPGGNFDFRFNVLPGDVNQNGVVQSNDGLTVRAALGTSTSTGGLYSVFKDINANGVIQSNDGLAVRNKLGSALPSDEPGSGMEGMSAPLSEAGGLPAPLSKAGEAAQPTPTPSAVTSPAASPGIPIPTSSLSGSGAFDVLAAAAPVGGRPRRAGPASGILVDTSTPISDSLYDLERNRRGAGLIRSLICSGW